VTTRKGISTRDKKYSLLHTPQMKGSKNNQTMVGDQGVRPLCCDHYCPTLTVSGIYRDTKRQPTTDVNGTPTYERFPMNGTGNERTSMRKGDNNLTVQPFP